MRRTLLSIALIAGLALPAAAADNPCITVEVLGYDNGLRLGEITYEEGAPRYAEAGPFLWLTWGGGDGWGFEDTLTFDVSDASSVVACADGSVDITRVEAPVEPVTVDAGVPVEVVPEQPATLSPVCEVYAATLTHVCTLPNLTLTIS